MPAPPREISATQYVTLVQSTMMPDPRIRPDVLRGRRAVKREVEYFYKNLLESVRISAG